MKYLKNHLLTLSILILFNNLIFGQSNAKRINESFEKGDILTSTTGRFEDGVVTKTKKKYDDGIFGVFITSSSIKNISIADRGIAEVKFSNRNGEVKRGDYITSSELPGTSMKSTQSGIIAGIALENSDGRSMIKMFIQPMWINQ